MAVDVHDALIDVLVVHENMPKAKAEEFLKDMKLRLRYVLDVWA
jgi:sulfite reductase alpha subunit-like flavoprotein